MELQETYDKLTNQGYGLAAISYDSPAILKSFADRKHITYPLLADEGSRTIRAFHILNEEVAKDSMYFGIPHPVTYVVNAVGIIQSRHFEKGLTERETLGSILVHDLGANIGAAESIIQAKYLTIVSSASNANIRSGEHIRLRLDITLPPNMHVYAPGVQGYIPIDWKMPASPVYDAAAVFYPRAQILYLKAIDEKVPVFLGSFSLVREITIAPAAKLAPSLDPERNLTIDSTFTYQACDDRMCYLPQHVPVHWKLHFEPHDVQRAPESIQHRAPNQPHE